VRGEKSQSAAIFESGILQAEMVIIAPSELFRNSKDVKQDNTE